MVTTLPTALDESGLEVANLFEIHGAVDQHHEFNVLSEEGERIALLLPVYRRPDVHWYRDFVTATGLAEQYEIEDPLARARNALGALAEIRPRCRNQARRLFAASLAAQAFPELTPRELAAGALGLRALEGSSDPDAHANALAALLHSSPEPDTPGGRDAWWDRLISSEAVQAGASSEGAPAVVGPRPCSGELAWVDLGGDRDLVPTLKTEYEAPIAFDGARLFCDDPTRWKCFPSWCDMDEVGLQNGLRRYREVVSFNCHNNAFPKLAVNLNFTIPEFQDGPARTVTTEYWLADRAEPRVLVNQGYLEIQELARPPDPMVRATTTKSIMFSRELGGAGLAITACHLGYLSMVEDLICCASRREGEEGYPDVPFRGRRPSQQARARSTAPASTPTPGTGVNYPALTKVMVDEVWQAVEDCIDECSEAAQRSAAKLDAGYKSDDLIQDMVDWWMRMLREGARFADMSLRIGRTSAPDGDPPPASDATPRQVEL